VATETDAAGDARAVSQRTGEPLYGPRRARWPAHLFAAAVIVLTVGLGLWQWQRAEQKAMAQADRDQALAAAPRLLDAAVIETARADAGIAVRLDGTRVRVRGRFVPEHTILLDNRTRGGIAGFHVLAPMRVDGTAASVLVLRGWIAADRRDRMKLPAPVTPTGVVEVEGLAVRELQQPLVLGGDTGTEPARLWQHFDAARFERWAGTPVAPLLVRQTVEPAFVDGLARDWNQPGVGVDRHRGYALQWFTMALVAAGGWIVLALRGRRQSGAGIAPAGAADGDR
jgi:surfeit locus 1 family protein